MGRFLRKFVEKSKSFIINRILLGCVMTIAPGIALYVVDRSFHLNWNLIRTTGWVYLALLVLYCIINIIRTWFELRTEDRKERQRIRESAVIQAGLLCMFSAQASDLANLLEEVWNHWHNAGEVLLYPLDINLPKTLDDTTDEIQRELRDFKVAYREHVLRVRADVPAFTSKTMTAFFPSNREYVIALRNLREHAASLESMAQILFDTGIPLKGQIL
jgi:hypothetical protein